MSASTRSSAPDAAILAVAAALFALAAGATLAADAPSKAPALPPQVAETMPPVKLIGGGELTFLGLSIYDGYYWGPARGYSMQQSFALDLHYRRTLKGAMIAERSVDEITKMGFGTSEDRSRWGGAMKRIFPNVTDGDRLTGVNVPGIGARFFHNGAPIGEIAEPAFAQAFFGIWLDAKTSRPDFRRQLLGE